ncbi:hypothetical protein PIROE2DRAFT_10134 [Piromyces sp. E2]|nr:hypothetical protein PIROE2DRAFT_10134 [Piromyces sp. E2]|eukprot:OUM63349.1 hypothetical protein PIROE2DRAFT_10134 [Piromyces sp. E2]
MERHYIVDEYYNLRNHDNIPDNKDNCLFEKSERKPIIETGDLYAEFYLEKPSSLENGLIRSNIPHDKMYNAGKLL